MFLHGQESSRSEASRPIVATELGELEGQIEHGIRVFRGIPFAASPAGELRWAPPQPGEAWDGVRDATRFGPDCPMPASLAEGVAEGDYVDERSIHGADYDVWFGAMAESGSEDCLTLNLWTPNPAPIGAPVMVFLSPTGSGSVPVFDGGTFARDGVVFVVPNHRLFTQSTFAHPALTRAELPNKPSSMLRDLDNIAALKWVRDHIRDFGGDPGNVTVFGVSNSGAGILRLMATPAAEGLFHRAIVQSGSSRNFPITYAGLESIGVELARIAGLDGENATTEQLRALPIDALPFFAAHTVNDHFGEQPYPVLFELGQSHEIALMIGSNTWDGSSLRYPPASIVERTPPDMLGAYEAEGLSGDALGYAIYTDEHVGAPARWYAARQAERGVPVYHYIYSYVSSFFGDRLGAAHAEEIAYVFDNLDRVPELEGLVISDRDRRIARMMHGCWVAFARTGEPRCEDVPDWPAYDEMTDWTMELGAAPRVHQHYRAAQYAAHDEHRARITEDTRDGLEVVRALRAVE
jgi:para-nitrobenzyl esterase